MGLSSAGIGSNLDVDGIVAKLMSVERQPLTKLATKEASYQAKLSGFGTLKGALSAFQTAVSGLSDIAQFQGVRVSAADTSVATVSGNSSAVPGAYSLKVTQLAAAQKLVAVGTASDIAPISNGVISFDFGTIAGGTFDSVTGKYSGAGFTSSGTGAKTVTIDASNNSLSGIRDAINKAAVGVTATIVNDGGASPYRLALSETSTGKASSVKISVTDDAPGTSTALSTLLNYDPAGTQALSQTSAAQNAEFTIDGIAVSKASNSVTDVIGGVTLNLLKENPTAATIVTVARDTTSVTTAVNAFVKAYNDINQNLRDAQAYDPTTKKGAILNGEASVRTIQTQVRNILTTPVQGGATTFSRLSEIGVTIQKDGLLAVDSTKLNAAISTNFSDLAGLFAASGKTADSLVTYTGASTATLPGAYGVNITQLATKGYTNGTAPVSSLIIGAGNDTLDVKLNGVTATIKLEQKTYTSAAALASELQSKINGASAFTAAGSAVSVTETGGQLTITSSRFGSPSNISISGGNGQTNLNFASSGASVVDGLDVAGTINGIAGTGSGQTLTGATGDASAGLAISITGGALGARGTINYSQGYAYQFKQLTNSLISSTGPLSSRTDGINASIKTLAKSQEALNSRLATIEKRYRAQFTALDLTISKMNTTSTFLTQQLASLSNIR